MAATSSQATTLKVPAGGSRTNAEEDLVEARVPLQRDDTGGHADAPHHLPRVKVEEHQRAALAAAVRARARHDQPLVRTERHLSWEGGPARIRLQYLHFKVHLSTDIVAVPLDLHTVLAEVLMASGACAAACTGKVLG